MLGNLYVIKMIRSAIRQINVINLLLLTVICLSVKFYLLPVLGENPAFPQPALNTGPPQQIVSAPVPFQPSPAAEYRIVSVQNIFHPERKIPAETKEISIAAKPEFLLYGTLITDSTALAYMEDRKSPRSSKGRGKRQQSVMLGKSLSGYILAEIQHDRVLMVRDEDRIEVKISAARQFQGKSTQVTIVSAPAEKREPMTILEKKPTGSGLPPGIIHKEMPPELKDKAPSQLKDLFNGLIKKESGLK